MGFPGGSAGKESACNVGDLISVPGLGRSPGEGICSPLQYSWASLVAQLVKNPPAMWETWVQSPSWKIPWRRDRLPTPVFLGFPRGSAGKESACSVGDLGSTPGLGRFPWRKERLPTPVFWPGESGVAKSQTRLSDSHFLTIYKLDDRQGPSYCI